MTRQASPSSPLPFPSLLAKNTRLRAEGSRETGRATKRAIVNFLAERAGSAYCAACISAQLFNGKDIDVPMRHLEGAGLNRRHQRCSSCQRVKLVASLPAPN